MIESEDKDYSNYMIIIQIFLLVKKIIKVNYLMQIQNQYMISQIIIFVLYALNFLLLNFIKIEEILD